jgi:hypothetical protein
MFQKGATDMSRVLKLETVVQSIESAFEPLECVVEVFDFQRRLRFRVFDPSDNPLFTMSEILVRSMSDPGGLNTIVTECRSRVEQKGYILNPWKVPTE